MADTFDMGDMLMSNGPGCLNGGMLGFFVVCLPLCVEKKTGRSGNRQAGRYNDDDKFCAHG
jgi:hypothetical protein